MFDQILTSTPPENALTVASVFAWGDVAVLLLLATFFTGLFCLLVRLYKHIYRMPNQVILLAKLILAVLFAGGVIVANQIWFGKTLVQFQVFFSPLALSFSFLIMASAAFAAFSALVTNSHKEKGSRALLAVLCLALSMMLSHVILLQGTVFEGRVLYFQSLFLLVMGLGVLLTFVSVILVQMALYMHQRRLALLPLLSGAVAMAAGVYMFNNFILRAAIFVPDQQYVLIGGDGGAGSIYIFGVVLVGIMGALFYLLASRSRAFLGHGRFFGVRWVHIIPLAICVITGVLTSFALFNATSYAEQKYVRGKFRADAQVFAGAVEHNLRGVVSALDTFKAFFQISNNNVLASDFKVFSEQKMLNSASVSAISFLDVSANGSEFIVKNLHADETGRLYTGQHIPNPGDDPATLNNGELLSYHLWQQALLSVYRNDATIGHIGFNGSSNSGVLCLIMPIYAEKGSAFTKRPAQREDLEAFIQNNVRGFLVAFAHITPLINEAREISGGESISLRLAQNEEDIFRDNSWDENHSWHARQHREFGGHGWTFHFKPIGGAYEQSGLMKWGVLLVSLLITFVLSAYLLSTLKSQLQNRRVQKKQAEQIYEIQKLNLDIDASRQEAEQANAAKDEFLANMSHEIRTPMNGMLGMADMLLESGLTTDQRRMASMLRRAGDNLMYILNDILDISKIRAGQMQIDQTVFSISELVGDVADLFSANCAEKGLAFNISVASDVPEAMLGDPLRIKQVLLNLVSNAIKFTEKGGVTIHVSTEKKRASTLYLAFAVEDTGIGIDADKVNEVFSKFSQLESTNTRRFGGTGLGLAICKSLSEMMKGCIHVRSVKGKGSVFTFCVPLQQEGWCEVPTTATPQNHLKQAPADASVSPARILVVEDNEINRELMARFLAREGFSVVYAKDGAEAVAMVRKNAYDIIFMDCQMPNMDGFQATEEIRAWEESNGNMHIPIIALTASAMAGDKEKCLASGMDAYISKPIKKENVLNLITQWLDPKPM